MSACQVVRQTTGDYASSRMLIQYLNRLAPSSGLRMVQFCHGYPATPLQFAASGSTPPGTLIEALLASGRYLPFAADQGGTSLFGSSAVPTDIEAANTYMAGLYGCRTDKFAMIGYSMGFLNASSEVYAHAAKVPVIIGMAPMTNGLHLYADLPSANADMDAASGSTWAAVDSTRSPIQRTSAFSGVHVECWQGTSDSTVRPADTSAFCTAVGGTYHPVVGDHGSLWLNITPSDVVAALDAGDWS